MAILGQNPVLKSVGREGVLIYLLKEKSDFNINELDPSETYLHPLLSIYIFITQLTKRQEDLRRSFMLFQLGYVHAWTDSILRFNAIKECNFKEQISYENFIG